MKRDDIIAALRAQVEELRSFGVASLDLIGSMARGDDDESSDVDVVVRLSDDKTRSGFAYFGQLDELTRRLEAIVGRTVDVITAPIQNERLQRQIEKERIFVF